MHCKDRLSYVLNAKVTLHEATSPATESDTYCSPVDCDRLVLQRLNNTSMDIGHSTMTIIISTACPKKMSFSGKTAITAFKLIQNAKVGGVLENSGYMLHHGH